MYYYAKPTSWRQDNPPIDFSRLWQRLDFRGYITHADNQDWYIEGMKRHVHGFPDLSAAVIAQMHRRGLLSHTYIGDALRYCRSMVEAEGYEQTVPPHLSDASTSTSHVILVFGCQGPEVRDARARACLQLVKNLRHVPLKIVFSGKNPSTTDSRKVILTRDEAAALQAEFQRLLDRDPTFEGRNFTFALEQQANSTAGNLRHFLEGPYLERNRPAQLFLLSSTFHLGRIAQEADAALAAYPDLSSGIARLVLVGAEVSAEEEIVSDERYVKAMMYEVFRHMFQHAPPSFRKDEYDGAV